MAFYCDHVTFTTAIKTVSFSFIFIIFMLIIIFLFVTNSKRNDANWFLCTNKTQSFFDFNYRGIIMIIKIAVGFYVT